MEIFLLLLLGGFLASAWSRVGRLERRVADLSDELAALRFARRTAEGDAAPEASASRAMPRAAEAPAEPPIASAELAAEPVAAPAAPPEQPPCEEPAEEPSDAPPARGFSFDFEDIFGRRLPIWGGGFALAIAGIFLVRFSIEAGLLTPAVRVAMSFVFGLALLAGAEVAYRFDARLADPRVRQALAGAGLATLYGAFYLAGTAYGLIGAGAAFIGLASVTAAAIALSFRFGLPSAVIGLVGGFAAPLVCGTLGETLGWAWGFGAAAIGMLIGLAVYLAGGRHMPPDTLRSRRSNPARQKLQPGDGRLVAALIVMLILGIFYSVAYGQQFNVFSLWAREALNRTLLGWTMPVTWFQALDGAFIVGLTPVALRIWQAQARRGREPSDMHKMAIGAALGALGMGCLVAASLIAATGAQASMLWAVACFSLFALGFIYQWPTTLALVSSAAPAPINATMMGVAFLFGGFVANYLAGWLGGYYEAMSPARFWALHGAISLVGAVATWLCAKPLNSVLLGTRNGAGGDKTVPALTDTA
ncbi:MAG: DUF2339 domain-containing protein [Porphyrobacter sp.]|nr:DUF2339 domain-containing protein [Porphyrobacter sp.]